LSLLSLRWSGGCGANWGGGGSGSSLGGQLVWLWGSSGHTFAACLPTLIAFPRRERASVSLGGPVCHKLLLVELTQPLWFAIGGVSRGLCSFLVLLPRCVIPFPCKLPLLLQG
jgi:hypothetical protein